MTGQKVENWLKSGRYKVVIEVDHEGDTLIAKDMVIWVLDDVVFSV